MQILMTQVVFKDADGVVHARFFEPETCCGRSALMTRESEAAGARNIRLGEGLPLSRLTVLPPVTCMECIAMAGDRACL